ncbi:MAG: dihydrolipoamide acetyltransferase family protein [Alphaproteobacteria bacterium]
MSAESPRIFALPDLGEGLEEAEIIAWHVSPGDHVVADQPIVSVETDKAVVDIPSPRSGRIACLFAKQGEHLKTGAPLIEFAGAEAGDVGAVVGELEVAAAGPVRAAATPLPARAAEGAAARVKASPAVRALAGTLAVELAGISGSGPGGEITKADVERAASVLRAGDGAEPLMGVRRAMARRMADAGAVVVPATVTEEADVEAWPAEADVTARLVEAIVAGCQAEPSLNAAFDGQTLTRRLARQVNVGIAFDTSDGLFVPVLFDAASRDAAALRREIDALKQAVAGRTIPPAALRGATITLSNFGTLGGMHASLVVVPPQVAILGAGRISARAVVRGESLAARRTLPLSLTFDHRAVSGGEAGRFLRAVKAELERMH